jgi:hypothetical protein
VIVTVAVAILANDKILDLLHEIYVILDCGLSCFNGFMLLSGKGVVV